MAAGRFLVDFAFLATWAFLGCLAVFFVFAAVGDFAVSVLLTAPQAAGSPAIPKKKSKQTIIAQSFLNLFDPTSVKCLPFMDIKLHLLIGSAGFPPRRFLLHPGSLFHLYIFFAFFSSINL
ncbi:MAG TPA: hypothetical protein PLB95_04570 [Syntrophales bacterium]|nr:hypothetical protein [Syntrophales bacterium]